MTSWHFEIIGSHLNTGYTVLKKKKITDLLEMKNLKYTFSSVQIRSVLIRCSLVLVMLVTLHVTLCGNKLMEKIIPCYSLDLNPKSNSETKIKGEFYFFLSIRLLPTIASKSNTQWNHSIRMRTLRARMTPNLLLGSARLQYFRFPVLSFSPSQLFFPAPMFDTFISITH